MLNGMKQAEFHKPSESPNAFKCRSKIPRTMMKVYELQLAHLQYHNDVNSLCENINSTNSKINNLLQVFK
jgi:cell division septation protein DedD